LDGAGWHAGAQAYQREPPELRAASLLSAIPPLLEEQETSNAFTAKLKLSEAIPKVSGGGIFTLVLSIRDRLQI